MAKTQKIVFFPKLDSVCSGWEVFCGTPLFIYKDEFSVEKQLVFDICENKNYGEFIVSDGVFNPELYDLHLEGSIVLKGSDIFYGSGGIVPESAEFGVAVMWTAIKNNIRGTINCKCVDRGNGVLNFTYEHSFDKGMLATALEFQYVLYLKSCGEVKENEKHLAQIPGTLLGELGKHTFYLKGNGSQFPICECDFTKEELLKVYKNALWMLDFRSSYPYEDPFDKDNVCLYLNVAHRDFKLLNNSDQENSAGRLDNPLLREILASASAVIIQKTVEKLGAEWQILQYDDFETGSVAQAVFRMASKCGLDKSRCGDISYLSAKLDSEFFGFCSKGALK